MEEKAFKDKNLLDKLKEYINNRIDIIRIDFIEKSSEIISKILTTGFFIVAGIYALLVVILAIGRKFFFETPLINFQIKKHFRK